MGFQKHRDGFVRSWLTSGWACRIARRRLRWGSSVINQSQSLGSCGIPTRLGLHGSAALERWECDEIESELDEMFSDEDWWVSGGEDGQDGGLIDSAPPKRDQLTFLRWVVEFILGGEVEFKSVEVGFGFEDWVVVCIYIPQRDVTDPKFTSKSFNSLPFGSIWEIFHSTLSQDPIPPKNWNTKNSVNTYYCIHWISFWTSKQITYHPSPSFPIWSSHSQRSITSHQNKIDKHDIEGVKLLDNLPPFPTPVTNSNFKLHPFRQS